MTPTARSLKLLRDEGWTCEVVERWIPGAHVRKDCLGCIDLLAVKPGHGVLGVQATSGSNHAARVSKAKREPRLATWLSAGCRFEVWSWAKIENRWQVRKTPMVLDAMDVVDIPPPRRRSRRPEPSLFKI